jgi:hypothetical protein
MSGGPLNRRAGRMSAPAFVNNSESAMARSPLGPILDLDPFVVDSNAAKLPVGRGHSRPRAADKLEDNT